MEVLNKRKTKLTWSLFIILVGSLFFSAQVDAKSATYYAKPDTYLYAKQSTSSKKLTTLKQNQKFTTTSKASATYYKVKIGKKTGYIPKSKALKKKTWYYYADQANLYGYAKRSFQATSTRLTNKKGTLFISNETPKATKSLSSEQNLIQVIYKGKKYYVPFMYLNVGKTEKQLRSYFKNVSKSKDYAFQSTYFDTYTFYDAKRAKAMQNYIERKGFVKVSSTLSFFNPYTYTYKFEQFGSYKYYTLKVNKK
ncbi:SH3 domain-containing protein [Kurthia gibsonii]|uniref:SH3 domain-containing protein n=1 Tax=Kurthia gibsonii TaxID=33946 RepID=UPI002DB8B6D5|nr:SH3 domain-containing protein [Kurthia gibsonii]MEB7772408.1 SH3 domain-containing protein [Kurthia gibsonii]